MPSGRPKKFKTAEALQEAIDAYFATEDCPTVCGLCYAINMTRETFRDYGTQEIFSDTIKRARMRIESAVEKNLMYGKNPVGAIFNLKNNFGWRDKSEIDQRFDGGLSVTWSKPDGKD